MKTETGARKAASRSWFVLRNPVLVFVVITLLIRILGIFWGEQLWRIYFPAYQGIRVAQDAVLGWVTFPLVYIWLPVLLGWIGYRLFLRWKNRKSRPKTTFGQRFKRGAKRIFNLGGAAFVLFHVLWGFNYLHNPLAAMMPDDQKTISSEELCFEAEWAARNAEHYRRLALGTQTDSVSVADLPEDFEAQVEKALIKMMDSLKLPHSVAANGKRIHPKGAMMRVGISGIYNPFTGEGNIDGGMAPVMMPDVMGHEMSHGMGYTDEGSCNFLGILACMSAEHPMLRYSGYFSYYLYIAGDLFQADPDLQQMVRHTVDEGMAADLGAYRNAIKRYRGWMSRVGQSVNHAYLSTQGVRGGIDNYGTVVAYMHHLRVSRHFGQQRRKD